MAVEPFFGRPLPPPPAVPSSVTEKPEVKFIVRSVREPSDGEFNSGDSKAATHVMRSRWPEAELFIVTVVEGNALFTVVSTDGRRTLESVLCITRGWKGIQVGTSVLVRYHDAERQHPYIKCLSPVKSKIPKTAAVVNEPPVYYPWGWDGVDQRRSYFHPSNAVDVSNSIKIYSDYEIPSNLGWDSSSRRFRETFESSFSWDWYYDFYLHTDGIYYLRKNGILRTCGDIGETFFGGQGLIFDYAFPEEFITDVTIRNETLFIRTVKDTWHDVPDPYSGVGITNTYYLWVSFINNFPGDLTQIELGKGGFDPDLFPIDFNRGSGQQQANSDNTYSSFYEEDVRITPSKLSKLNFVNDDEIWISAFKNGVAYVEAGNSYLPVNYHFLEVKADFTGSGWTVTPHELGELDTLRIIAFPKQFTGWFCLGDKAIAYGVPEKLICVDVGTKELVWEKGENTDTSVIRYTAIMQVGDDYVLCLKEADVYNSYTTVLRPSSSDIDTLDDGRNVEEQVEWVLDTYNVETEAFYFAGTTRSYVLVDRDGAESSPIPIPDSTIYSHTTSYRAGAFLYQMDPFVENDVTHIVQAWWRADEYRHSRASISTGLTTPDPDAGELYRTRFMQAGFTTLDGPTWAASNPGVTIAPAGLSNGFGGLLLVPFGWNFLTAGFVRSYGLFASPVVYPQKKMPDSNALVAESAPIYPIDDDADIAELILEVRYLSSATVGYDPGEEIFIDHFHPPNLNARWANDGQKMISAEAVYFQRPLGEGFFVGIANSVRVKCYKVGATSALWDKEYSVTGTVDCAVFIGGNTVNILIDIGIPGKLHFLQLYLNSGRLRQEREIEMGYSDEEGRLPKFAFNGRILTIGDTAFGIYPLRGG